MGKSRVQTRVPDDLKDRLEEYQEERNISEADAVRRLIRVGLDREEQTVPDGGEVMSRLDELSRQQEEMAQQQESAQQLRNVATLAGVAYVAVTVGLSMSSVLWGVLGIVLVVGIGAGVYLSGASA